MVPLLGGGVSSVLRAIGAASSVILLLCLACCVQAAPMPNTKPDGTIVFAVFGDWGWSPVGANNSFLVSLLGPCSRYTVKAVAAGRNASAYRTEAGGPCLDGSNTQQGVLVNNGLQNVAQKATAAAMATACANAGGCDFVLNAGDAFYDLGVSSVDDPQWAAAFEDVYTTELFGDAPFLGTIGNHDTSILSPAAAQVQLNYSTLHPRWHMPARNFERTFASGNSSVQVVVFDSMPLTDRWFYSGASGTTFVAGDSVADDTAHNAVINPGVTRANGFEGPNLFNASRFQCGFDFAAGTIAGPANCKYASVEPAPFATPAARAAAWANITSMLEDGHARKSTYQVTLTHMPLLSAQQRQMPLYHDAMAALRALGVAAPQIAFNGHDHINAILVDPNYRTEFWTSGAGGISDFGRAGVYPPAGYALAGGQHLTELINKSYSPYPPRRGVAAYNPDVNRTQFWSEFNGFVLCTANAAALSCSVHLVNCSAVATTGSCGPQPYMGAVFTRRYGPKHAKKA